MVKVLDRRTELVEDAEEFVKYLDYRVDDMVEYIDPPEWDEEHISEIREAVIDGITAWIEAEEKDDFTSMTMLYYKA